MFSFSIWTQRDILFLYHDSLNNVIEPPFFSLLRCSNSRTILSVTKIKLDTCFSLPGKEQVNTKRENYWRVNSFSTLGCVANGLIFNQVIWILKVHCRNQLASLPSKHFWKRRAMLAQCQQAAGIVRSCSSFVPLHLQSRLVGTAMWISSAGKVLNWHNSIQVIRIWNDYW